MRQGKDFGSLDGSDPKPEPKRLDERGPARKAWGERYGFDETDVTRIVLWAKRCARANTHWSNGDEHPQSTDKTDKNANSKAWGMAFDFATDELAKIVRPKGYKVTYNGLFPTLEREGDESHSTIFIPTN